jgi:hypothetical protein
LYLLAIVRVKRQELLETNSIKMFKSLRDHDIVISGSNSSEGFVDAEMKVELREPSLFRDGRGQTTLG